MDKVVASVVAAILSLAVGALVTQVSRLDGEVNALQVELAVTKTDLRYANSTLARIEGLLLEEENSKPPRRPR